MKNRHRWAVAAVTTFGALAWALPSLIATEDMVIEVRTTADANLISVTDVHRNADEITPLGPTRVYTERR